MEEPSDGLLAMANAYVSEPKHFQFEMRELDSNCFENAFTTLFAVLVRQMLRERVQIAKTYERVAGKGVVQDGRQY